MLANRLSTDASTRVLLIEAGGRDSSPLIHVPAGNVVMLRRGLHCWKYVTVPQKHLNDRQLYDPRGKVLGGTSSINGMIYDRGSARDFDHWRALGNEGWSYADVLPYFRRSECYQPGADAYHGGDGPLHVSRSELQHPFFAGLVRSRGTGRTPYNDDINGASRPGLGPTQLNPPAAGE